jgi:8-oxo-dGTP pyrophosphatase MutT (NUDIX family)
MSRTTVPRPAATTLVLRDQGGALQVLMLRRSLSASFVPGSYVFPGGAVDAADSSSRAEMRCLESRVEASVRTGLSPPVRDAALAYLVAALRECFEECGLWLGGEAVEAQRLAAARQRLLAGTTDFVALSEEFDLPLATTLLAPWSHWVTPIDLPKRFDTVFFVALAPTGQQPAIDGGETIRLVWVNPAEALTLHHAGGLPLEFSTRQALTSLLPFANATALMQAAREPRLLEAHHPRVARTCAGERCVLLPHDAGYADVMRLDPEGTGMAVVPEADSPEQRLTRPPSTFPI